MKDKPNMYGILPANVRYQEGLSSFAKVVFAEINALSNKNGYCHATNAYFENVFSKSTATISRVLTELQEHGAIKVKDGGGGESIRKITPCTPTQKLVRSAPQKLSDPLRKNEEQNNTSNNIQDNISKDILETPPKVLAITGNSSLSRVINFYIYLWLERYGTKPTINYPRAGKALKPLLANLGELKTALVVLQYFHWKGATGTDDFLAKRLVDNTYPLYWIPDHADPILAYLRNYMKLNVDSEKEVEKVVTGKLTQLLRTVNM